MRTCGSNRENACLENCFQNLSPGNGLQTITGDELWRKYGPQTLRKAIDFIGRAVKEKFTESGLTKDGITDYILA